MMTYWKFWLIYDPIFFHERVHACNQLHKSICLAFSEGGGLSGLEGA